MAKESSTKKITVSIIPEKVGKSGFFTSKDSPLLTTPEGYDIEEDGDKRYYFFTKNNYSWPLNITIPTQFCVSVSPLNPNSKINLESFRPVLIGASLKNLLGGGVKWKAPIDNTYGTVAYNLKHMVEWFKFLDFNPVPHEIADLPEVRINSFTQNKDGTFIGVAPNMVNIKDVKDKRTREGNIATFEYNFAPNIYLLHTGAKEVMKVLEALERDIKILPVGGFEDGSGTGPTHYATSYFLGIVEKEVLHYNIHDDSARTTWNLFAYNILSTSRHTKVNANILSWCDHQNGGVVIPTVLAKISKGLDFKKEFPAPDANETFTQEDIDLLGMCAYAKYFQQLSINNYDLQFLAKYLNELAIRMGILYEQEAIKDCSPVRQYVFAKAKSTLSWGMHILTMKEVEL